MAGGVLSRSMKTGPVLPGLGAPDGSGGGVISAEPVGIGVGGISWPGPGAGGTFGILSGVGEGDGLGVSVSSDAGLGEEASPDVSVGLGLGLGTCATTTGMLSESIIWIALRSSDFCAVEGAPHDSRISFTKRGSSESESEASADG